MESTDSSISPSPFSGGNEQVQAEIQVLRNEIARKKQLLSQKKITCQEKKEKVEQIQQKRSTVLQKHSQEKNELEVKLKEIRKESEEGKQLKETEKEKKMKEKKEMRETKQKEKKDLLQPPVVTEEMQADFEAQIVSLKNQLDSMRLEILSSEREHKESERELAEAEEFRKDLEECKEELLRQIEELRTKLSENTRQQNTLIKEKEKFEEQMKLKVTHSEKGNSMVAEIEDGKNIMARNLIIVNQKCAELKKKIARKTFELGKLKESHANLLFDLKKKTSYNKSAYGAAEGEINELKQKIETLELKMEKLISMENEVPVAQDDDDDEGTTNYLKTMFTTKKKAIQDAVLECQAVAKQTFVKRQALFELENEFRTMKNELRECKNLVARRTEDLVSAIAKRAQKDNPHLAGLLLLSPEEPTPGDREEMVGREQSDDKNDIGEQFEKETEENGTCTNATDANINTRTDNMKVYHEESHVADASADMDEHKGVDRERDTGNNENAKFDESTTRCADNRNAKAEEFSSNVNENDSDVVESKTNDGKITNGKMNTIGAAISSENAEVEIGNNAALEHNRDDLNKEKLLAENISSCILSNSDANNFDCLLEGNLDKENQLGVSVNRSVHKDKQLGVSLENSILRDNQLGVSPNSSIDKENQLGVSTNSSIDKENQLEMSTNDSIDKENQLGMSTNSYIDKENQPQSLSANSSIDKENQLGVSTNSSIDKENQPLSLSANSSIDKENQPQSSSANSSIDKENQLGVSTNSYIDKENQPLSSSANSCIDKENQLGVSTNSYIDKENQPLSSSANSSIDKENQLGVSTNSYIDKENQPPNLQANSSVYEENQFMNASSFMSDECMVALGRFKNVNSSLALGRGHRRFDASSFVGRFDESSVIGRAGGGLDESSFVGRAGGRFDESSVIGRAGGRLDESCFEDEALAGKFKNLNGSLNRGQFRGRNLQRELNDTNCFIDDVEKFRGLNNNTSGDNEASE